MILKEACVGSFQEALRAQHQGAHRVELCDNLAEGGTTPSYGTIYAAVHKLSIPAMVMIRPRGGDFVYDDDEIDLMLKDIEVCQQLGAYGVVFGALRPIRKEPSHFSNPHQTAFVLDEAIMDRLIEAARPMKITVHMAFDWVSNPYDALEYLMKKQVDRVLTKGGTLDAIAGQEQLSAYKAYVGDRMVILPGGGIHRENAEILAAAVGVSEVHGTRVVGDLK